MLCPPPPDVLKAWLSVSQSICRIVWIRAGLINWLGLMWSCKSIYFSQNEYLQSNALPLSYKCNASTQRESNTWPFEYCWRCGVSNPGLSACKADALPLCHIPNLSPTGLNNHYILSKHLFIPTLLLHTNIIPFLLSTTTTTT